MGADYLWPLRVVLVNPQTAGRSFTQPWTWVLSMARGYWVTRYRCGVLGALERTGYSLSIAVSSFGMAALPSVPEAGGCTSELPTRLGWSSSVQPLVDLSPVWPVTWALALLDHPVVACPLQCPAARVLVCSVAKVCHVHLSFAVSDVGRVTLVLRTVEEALMPEPGVRGD